MEICAVFNFLPPQRLKSGLKITLNYGNRKYVIIVRSILPFLFRISQPLAEVSCQEVFNLIQKIPSSKASDLDNISARLLKEASPIVTRSLTFMINLSITTGIFPNAWKRARVSPIFKENLNTDRNNYRPISVLPVVMHQSIPAAPRVSVSMSIIL